MKSFNQFISEKRSEEIEKITDRQRLERTPFLTDDEMRKQNPGATKAYEDDVASRKKTSNPSQGAKNPKSKRIITVNNPRRIVGGIETNAPDKDIAKLQRSFEKSPDKSTSRAGESSRPTSPKPETVSQSEVSKKQDKFRKTSSGSSTYKPTSKGIQDTVASGNKPRIPKKDLSKQLANITKSSYKSTIPIAKKVGGRVLPGVEAALSVAAERQKGSGWLRSAAKAATVAAGGALGATAGSVAGPVGSIAGGYGGAVAADKAFDAIAGKNAKERKAAAVMNRQRQYGKKIVGVGGETKFDTKKNTITTGGRTVKLANTSVVTDPTTGKKEVGYLAYKDGKAVYKRGQAAGTNDGVLGRLKRWIDPKGAAKRDAAANAAKLKQAQANDAQYRKALSGK
jgi:hypothetical protein